jgi:tetratricopeptide (TPR) repeat protein
MPRRSTALLAALLVLPSVLHAQHEQHTGSSPPEKLGTVAFENSCAAQTRADFNRAVALLHSFEFRAATEGFGAALAKDPNCAMAHWGISLAYWGNPFAGVRSPAALAEGLAAIGKARVTGRPTARERAFIAAAGALFDNYETVPQRERVLAYERRMAEVVRENPRDIEAQVFHALAVNQTALPTDQTYAAQLRAAAILEPLYAEHPDHPGLAHYIIHAYDHPPLAARALGAARRYASIAPSAPHALHMPSHTFTRVGSWADSAATNRKSEQSALQNNVATEALHAMDYQAYAYLQMAQDRAAREVIGRLPSATALFDSTASVGGAAPPMAGYYALAAIPARYALERGAWQDAAALKVPSAGPPFTIAMTHFARALGAARSGLAGAATADVAALAVLRDRLKGQDDYWAGQVDIQWRVTSAWIAFAEERRTEAIAALREAADLEDATDKSAVTPGPLAPARELLGEMLLEAGDASGALRAFEASMAKEPGRLRGAFGAARAAEAAGDAANARKHYARMLEIAATADTARPELERARRYLAAT